MSGFVKRRFLVQATCRRCRQLQPKEGQAMWMERTYAALRVPHDHIRVEKLEPRHPAGINGDHYHFGVIGINFTPLDADGGYAFRGDWAFALGQGTGVSGAKMPPQ